MHIRNYINEVLRDARRGGPRYDEAKRDYNQMLRDQYRHRAL